MTCAAVRPHLVHLTTQLPEPRGGPTRQFHLLREAALRLDVTVLAGEAGGPHAPEALDAVARFARAVPLTPAPWRRDPAARALRLARIAASPRPYGATRYDPLRGPAAAALGALHRPPDILHVEPSNVAGWLDLAPPGARRVAGFHDVLYAVERDAARLAPPVRRVAAEVEWRKLRAQERRAGAAADLCVMTSEPDAAALRAIAPGARTVVVPNGVDAEWWGAEGAEGEEDDLVVFTGSMNHPPNRRAAELLAREILPALRERRPGARLEIVGREPGPEVRRLGGEPGVRVTGEVPDVRPYLRRAAVAVAPLEFGGGVRNKVLEALAAGVATVATPKGAEGLELDDGQHLLVRSPAEFPEAVAGLLADPGRRAALARAGRRRVADRYRWEALGAAFADALVEVAGTPAAASGH